MVSGHSLIRPMFKNRLFVLDLLAVALWGTCSLWVREADLQTESNESYVVFFVSSSYFSGSSWKICISVRRNLLWRCTTPEGNDQSS